MFDSIPITLYGVLCAAIGFGAGWSFCRARIPSRRHELIMTLAKMPAETFSWFVAWTQRGYPDGLGGFKPENRWAIERLKAAGARFAEDDE